MKASFIYLCLAIVLRANGSFSQLQDFKGVFYVKNHVNQKGVEIPEVKDVFFKSSKGTFIIKDCEEKISNKESIHLKKAILRANLQVGPIDVCDVNDQSQSRVGKHLIPLEVIMENEFRFYLQDGSGNAFFLNGDTLSYVPVSKEMSSSGVYSGGVQKTIVLSENNRILVTRNFRRTNHSSPLTPCDGIREKGKIALSYAQLGGDRVYCGSETKQWQRFKKKLNGLLNH
ncbi:MAG: hypothetical protein FJY17_07215 [Bacteroidetes bacterium]|nr:hypothetical protein [Bacteroidota bacterium]